MSTPKASRSTQNKRLRLCGLELGGGKSGRTALVVFDFYPKQRKLFLTDHQAHIAASAIRTGDEVLLEALATAKLDRIGVNAPITMPPCVPCALADCGDVRKCKQPAVRWMRDEAEQAGITALKFPTPYTQRPLDVYLRTRIQPRFRHDLFIEESLGAGRAPLALRWQFLRQRLGRKKVFETSPRLALLTMARAYGITDRELRRYRSPEEGVEYRLSILERLQGAHLGPKVPELFLYEAERLTLARELPSFQALLSALACAFAENRLIEKPDADYDPEWGFVLIPNVQ